MERQRVLRSITSLILIVSVALGAGLALAQTDNGTPVLGIQVQEDAAGALVTRVLPGGPADEAGIEVGDIITTLDGETVTAADLAGMIAERSVGDTVELEVLRGDELTQVSATLAARDDVAATAEPAPEQTEEPGQLPETGQGEVQRFTGAFLGIGLTDEDEGVVIQEVVPGSPAEDAGLQVGDIITGVNGETIERGSDVVDAVRGMNPGDTLTLEIERDGETQTIEATLGEAGVSISRFDLAQNIVVYNSATEQWHVVRVSEDSPLYAAGLRDGDIITQVNGETYTPESLSEYLSGLTDDADVTLTVEREGETQEITVAASDLEALTSTMFSFGRGGDMPFHFNMPFDMPGFMMGRPQIYLGVTFVQLNAETAAERGVDETEGALVVEVAPDSPADTAGLQADDIITAVDGDVIDEERTLVDRLSAYEPDDTVTLTVLRDGETMDIDVTLEAARVGRGQGHGMMPFFFGPDGQQPFGIPETPQEEVTPAAPMA